VDDLPPSAPAPFPGAFATGATRPYRGLNTGPRIAQCRLYLGSSSDFQPEAGNVVTAQPDAGFADVGPAGRHYQLAAMDIHGRMQDGAPDMRGAVPGVAPPGLQ
jgi:hypothetical protein